MLQDVDAKSQPHCTLHKEMGPRKLARKHYRYNKSQSRHQVNRTGTNGYASPAPASSPNLVFRQKLPFEWNQLHERVKREEERAHHVWYAVLDPVDMLALRADHLSVRNYDLSIVTRKISIRRSAKRKGQAAVRTSSKT